MRFIVSAVVFGLVAAGAGIGPAQAKGCLKGAAVGGVAGHLAGHGVLGAAAGCVIGHHQATKEEQQAQQRAHGSDGDAPVR
jgi:hypothetical protein